MDHHSSTRKSLLLRLMPAACVGLLVACGTGGDAAKDKAGNKHPEALVAALDCDNPFDVAYRHKHYTRTELAIAKRNFTDNFKVVFNGSEIGISDPVLNIPWRTIANVQRSIGTKEKPVRGMYIHYGMAGANFHPIFEFMYPDTVMGDLQIIPNAAYSFDVGKKELVLEQHPDDFMNDYLKMVKVDRSGAGTGTSELKAEDPSAIWFPYADNLSQLLAQNQGPDPNHHIDTVLVVSCISEKLCYKALTNFTVEPEFRHLIALNIADGGTDLLSDDLEMTMPFQNMAMDLGTMCPPVCKSH